MYLIEILHQTTTLLEVSEFLLCCILSKFYIKPQPEATSSKTPTGCILSKFYIKPQPPWATVYEAFGCILSKFYIKPQLNRDYGDEASVVSYRNSTSNHNFVGSVRIFVVLYLIEILHQTTTGVLTSLCDLKLYLIEILHQTTTVQAFPMNAPLLYLIEILHQTTTTAVATTSDS